MVKNQLRLLAQGLFIPLFVAVLLNVLSRSNANALPINGQRSVVGQVNENLPDIKEMIKMANHLQAEGNYSAAAAIWEKLLAIAESALGPDHPGTAKVLGNLANLYRKNGRYSEAEQLLIRDLRITEKNLGPAHSDVATTLHNLALVYVDQGKYYRAEASYLRAMAIDQKAGIQNSVPFSDALNNLANLYVYQGSYAKAEVIHLRSLEIREKILGLNHVKVAMSLNDLAYLYGRQAQYAKARQCLLRALAIYEIVRGSNHPDVATILENIAGLYSDQGQYSSAKPLFMRSLAIRERVLGPNHPDVANSLSNIAALYSIQGDYSKAKPLLERALVAQVNTFGLYHPNIANTIANMAHLLFDQEQYARSESLYLRAVDMHERSFGYINLDAIRVLKNLAGLYDSQRRHQKTVTMLRRALDRELSWLCNELPLMAENARTKLVNKLGNSWQLPSGLLGRYPLAAPLSLHIRLNRHGLMVEIERRQQLLLNTPNIPRDKVEQLQGLTQQLASVAVPAARRAALRQERDRLQAEVYRALPDLKLEPVTIAAVAKALPADGVLIEFQRFQPYNSRQPRHQRWGAPQYLALILKPNGAISAVQLGPAAPIEATIQKGLAATAQNQSDAMAIWKQLSDQVLRPLLPQLRGSRQWFLSPDGELNRVPFAALPSPQQADLPLAQAVQLRLLSTGRELVRLQQPTPPGQSPLVMANPTFDRPGQASRPPTPPEDERLAQRRSSDLGATSWKPLPASEQEGQQVAQLLATKVISGSDATVPRLTQATGPRVLHVATHGFFLADAESKPQDPLRIIQDEGAQLRPLRQDDPQLRSGLVLAGANQPDADPNDDGYLTAAEALTLNLKGTELVVLSACSTGQGSIRTGEGVYGLQRSLTVAGARSTLLSLWKVDDAATAEFMTRFYKRLKAGEGRSDALAATQRDFREGLTGKKEWQDPAYWAAWQLVGDWRPIPGL